jgi:hypothetical protein
MASQPLTEPYGILDSASVLRAHGVLAGLGERRRFHGGLIE